MAFMGRFSEPGFLDAGVKLAVIGTEGSLMLNAGRGIVNEIAGTNVPTNNEAQLMQYNKMDLRQAKAWEQSQTRNRQSPQFTV